MEDIAKMAPSILAADLVHIGQKVAEAELEAKC